MWGPWHGNSGAGSSHVIPTSSDYVEIVSGYADDYVNSFRFVTKSGQSYGYYGSNSDFPFTVS